MNDAPSHVPLASDLVQRFVQLFAVGRRIKSDVPVGIPGLDRAALGLLMQLSHGGTRVGELADACHLDLSTASRHASTLASLGLVSKVPDPEDRRALVLTLTPEGIEAAESIRRRRGLLFADILAEWQAEDLQRLDAYLARFVNDVERHLHQLPGDDNQPLRDENQQGNH